MERPRESRLKVKLRVKHLVSASGIVMVIFAVGHDAGELHLSLSGSDFEAVYVNINVWLYFFFTPTAPFTLVTSQLL